MLLHIIYDDMFFQCQCAQGGVFTINTEDGEGEGIPTTPKG